MSLKVIAFGSIGTLIETSDIQRESFNTAFKVHGLDWNWTQDDYRQLLNNSGGRQRIEDYAKKLGIDVDAVAIHASKTKIFDAHIEEHGAPIRDGVKNVIEFAKSKGMRLAFVSSTSEDNIDATLAVLRGVVGRGDFSFIGNSSLIENGKPAPDIYIKAMQELHIQSDEVIAIEDSAPSLKSALAAGIRCIAFPGKNTGEQNYEGALVKVSTLDTAIFDDKNEH
jgi:beta-phosphoglucomutase-like phosphatase (HAD superfamily)